MLSSSKSRRLLEVGDYWFELKMPLDSGDYSEVEKQSADAVLKDGRSFYMMVRFVNYEPANQIGQGFAVHVVATLESSEATTSFRSWLLASMVAAVILVVVSILVGYRRKERRHNNESLKSDEDNTRLCVLLHFQYRGTSSRQTRLSCLYSR